MINYYSLGKKKQLNQIVFAGTHDAGITGGGSGVKTQSLNIGQQAGAGVRFFDIRIAAAVTSQVDAQGRPVAELRAFHADDKVVMKLDRNVVLKGAGPDPVKLKQSKLAAGAFGQGLTEMLQQARNFVHSSVGGSEFLMLKFDKCTNWAHIAQACRDVLGLALYKGGGNLNTTTLEDLRGKVIVLFPSKGLAETHGATNGIMGFKNLSAEGTGYQTYYDGLQYYGKGGTSPFNPLNKIKQNIKKQAKLMGGAAALANPNVVGMMYWTTTGLIESIRKRDDGMWDAPNVAKMKNLWGQGLGDFVDGRVSAPAKSPMAKAQQRRGFFPNIVMIDFADDNKCQQIRDLNDLAAHHLTDLT
jgi:hypothetical protein